MANAIAKPANKKQLRNRIGSIYLTIWYDNENQWVYNDWQGMLSVENVKEGATEVLYFLKNFDCGQILNDNQKIIGPWDQANPWIAEVWIPKAMEAGLREFAHILAPGVYGVMSADQMAYHVGSQFKMQLFEDTDKAKNWLLECKEPL